MGSLGVTAETTRSTNRPSTSSDTSVLIIGGGPTGLLSAILLAEKGMPSIIVERHHTRLGQPKAHAVNPRSLEIFQQAGLDVDALRRLGADPRDADMVRFVASMTGIEFGHLPYERQTGEARRVTPQPLFNVPQPVLEEFLSDAVRQRKIITLWKPAQYERTIDKAEGKWRSEVLDRATGEMVYIQNRYILACDGSSSRSRAKFDTPFATLPGHPDVTMHHVSIHIQADLSHMKSGTLWFFMTPDQPGIMICYDRRSSWVYVMNYDPEEMPVSFFTEEYCRSKVDAAIGQNTPYEILTKTFWTTKPETAEFYRSRVIPQAFLLGDAAHVFPPTGGLGINTGIADAHNLVWKMAAVEQGWAQDELLDSFGHERRPIAIANARQSALNQQKLYKLLARAFAPEASDEALMHDQELQGMLNEAIKDNADHFDSINLQIGYIYGDERVKACDVYVPRNFPGARLPHAWISRKGGRCSTLDLIDGMSFVLLASEQFLESPQNVAAECKAGGIPLTVLCVGEDFSEENGQWTDLMGLRNSAAGVVVRPDQHIAFQIHNSVELLPSLQRYLSTVHL